MENDTKNLERLRSLAVYHKDKLSGHEVLKNYWDKLSLIMKGSTARGYSDKYSDIDFVIFTDSAVKDQIVSDYIAKGLTTRKDGIFQPLDEWEGHYNLDTYENLEALFERRDMENIWEYTNISIMHDGGGRYERIILNYKDSIFQDIDTLIRGKYLEIQLYLDWMRQPLRRADAAAAALYSANVLRYSAHLLYLLHTRAYPCDKWLFFHLSELDIPGGLREKIISYPKVFGNTEDIVPDKELMEYELYAKGFEIVSDIIEMLKERYGEQQWIIEWYLYA